MWTLEEIDRLLDDLVRAGLVEKAIRNGVEVFRIDLSYVERAKELMKEGREIHAAYFQAIAEQCPNLADESIMRLVAERVHEKESHSHKTRNGTLHEAPKVRAAGA